MALTIGEARAIVCVLRVGSGTGVDPVAEELRDAVDLLVTASHKRLAQTGQSYVHVSEIGVVVEGLWATHRPQRPEPMWDDEADGDDEAIEPRPLGRLDPIDGIVPVDLVTRLRGTAEHVRRQIGSGHSINFAGRGTVEDVTLRRTKRGPVRRQVVEVSFLAEIDGAAGERLVNTLMERVRTVDDALPFAQAGDDALVNAALAAGRTDGSGVAFTPSELAEALGDPTLPVVVLFAGGSRAVWPDDWPEGTARPACGERLDVPGAPPGSEPDLVAELADVAGRTLATVEDDPDPEGEEQ